MTTLKQVPAQHDFIVNATGDDFSYLFDFNISLVGYTFEAKVIGADGVETDIAITETNLSLGKITLSLTDTQITTIGNGIHSWYLSWTVATNTRRVIAGMFTIETRP